MYNLFISANHQHILSSKRYLDFSFRLKYFFSLRTWGLVEVFFLVRTVTSLPTQMTSPNFDSARLLIRQVVFSRLSIVIFNRENEFENKIMMQIKHLYIFRLYNINSSINHNSL